MTDPAKRTVSYVYDDNHNLTEIIDPMGIATARNEYDESGRVIAVIDADGNRTELDYDVEGKTQVVKDRMGNATVYTYDDNGNILKMVDAYGSVTRNEYDKNNHLLMTEDALGHKTHYTYDESGNITKITTADGTAVESTYTQTNQVAQIKALDMTVMAFGYDIQKVHQMIQEKLMVKLKDKLEEIQKMKMEKKKR